MVMQQDTTNYIELSKWMLGEYGLIKTILTAIFAFVLYFLWKLYNDTKPHRDEMYKLRLEGMKIENEKKANVIADDAIIVYLRYGFLLIQNSIQEEIIRVFDINDRFSETRKMQIPTELRAAAKRGLSDAIVQLSQFTIESGLKLSKPFVEIRHDRVLKDEFWATILQSIFSDDAKHARTASINQLNILIELEFDRTYKSIKDYNNTQKK